MRVKICVTGICGFVGSTLARTIREHFPGWTINGIDNLSRPGSELNRSSLQALGIGVMHGDLRNASDLESLPDIDWIIDAAANPSVLAGVDGKSGSRQVIENNLYGTVNLLEHCRRRRCGFILLSTSRVYSLEALLSLRLCVRDRAYHLAGDGLPMGISQNGVDESFPTTAPLSLYGSTKLASENLALEYHHAFGLPVWINRCGVLAGAGQFGRADQGIFSFWINSYLQKRQLCYTGFGGKGYQVRDCLHPRDLVGLIAQQMQTLNDDQSYCVNVSGGQSNSMSLAELSEWCGARFGRRHRITSKSVSHPFDVPWLILDSRRAAKQWNWRVETPISSILEEIATHAEAHPEWLQLSGL
jgi:CDP-paratose 2-epimerase